MSRPFPNLIRTSSRQRVDSIIDNLSSAQDIRFERKIRDRRNVKVRGIPAFFRINGFRINSFVKKEKEEEEEKRERVICSRCF